MNMTDKSWKMFQRYTGLNNHLFIRFFFITTHMVSYTVLLTHTELDLFIMTYHMYIELSLFIMTYILVWAFLIMTDHIYDLGLFYYHIYSMFSLFILTYHIYIELSLFLIIYILNSVFLLWHMYQVETFFMMLIQLYSLYKMLLKIGYTSNLFS